MRCDCYCCVMVVKCGVFWRYCKELERERSWFERQLIQNESAAVELTAGEMLELVFTPIFVTRNPIVRVGPVRRINPSIYTASRFAAFLPFMDNTRSAGRVVSNSHCCLLLLRGLLFKL